MLCQYSSGAGSQVLLFHKKVGKARHPAKFTAAAQKNGKLWCRDVGPAGSCNKFCLHMLAEFAWTQGSCQKPLKGRSALWLV